MIAHGRFRAEHAALVVRDSRSLDDLSLWDPETSKMLWMKTAFIFGVQPSIEGDVSVSVLQAPTDSLLQHRLGSGKLEVESGTLVVEDPAQTKQVLIEGVPRMVSIECRVDDLQWAAKVQLLLVETVRALPVRQVSSD